MYDQGIARVCLAVLVMLATATSCDVEPVDDLDDLDDLAEIDLAEESVSRQAESGAADVVDTDPLDPSSNAEPGGSLFPTVQCRVGFIQAGARLCISQFLQNAQNYARATSNCRNQRSQVCTYEDFSYLFLNTGLDANFNPNGRWIGNMVADDTVFCGNANITSNNDPDIFNFEGTCNKSNVRNYWCCHDDE